MSYTLNCFVKYLPCDHMDQFGRVWIPLHHWLFHIELLYFLLRWKKGQRPSCLMLRHALTNLSFPALQFHLKVINFSRWSFRHGGLYYYYLLTDYYRNSPHSVFIWDHKKLTLCEKTLYDLLLLFVNDNFWQSSSANYLICVQEVTQLKKFLYNFICRIFGLHLDDFS